MPRKPTLPDYTPQSIAQLSTLRQKVEELRAAVLALTPAARALFAAQLNSRLEDIASISADYAPSIPEWSIVLDVYSAAAQNAIDQALSGEVDLSSPTAD